MASVNAVSNYPQIQSLPIGGVGDPGFGHTAKIDNLTAEITTVLH
ncbi:hypothetical protein GCM10012275_01870 [Longimycelium tulufanense]|uniref:Uncharacterized protein n=1 Tax=Longimycelium tulufanense TaxID=907463 RepID=A0A8J3C9A5_9PSEU|nr:hypothetical protein [Longimycelium tulufanense]GGM34137.1 hypothetical protein GCM10012275_01870 [Longimycelium tulufanense]